MGPPTTYDFLDITAEIGILTALRSEERGFRNPYIVQPHAKYSNLPHTSTYLPCSEAKRSNSEIFQI